MIAKKEYKPKKTKENKSNSMTARDILSREIRLRFQKLQYESSDDDGDDDNDDSEDWSINDNLDYWEEEDDLNSNTEPIKIIRGRGPTIPPPPLLHVSPLIPQQANQQIKIGNENISSSKDEKEENKTEKIEIKDLSTKKEIMKMVNTQDFIKFY